MSGPLQKALLWGGAVLIVLIASWAGLDLDLISSIVREINQ